jgi:hypothetical protein
VCVCEREMEIVCVYERESERERECVYACKRELDGLVLAGHVRAVCHGVRARPGADRKRVSD